MALKKSPRLDMTPAGRLEEAQLQRVLGYQLAQASIVTSAIYARQVGEPFGLRPVEYTVLTLISENPGGSLARLARALAVTAPNITTMVDRLESRGWVARTQSEQDRRSQLLHTTAKGEALVRKSTQAILDAERKTLPLTPGEHSMLVELLHKVACARGVEPAN
jgi:DNA-binding MarR family transcriptional regulator